MGLGAFSRYFRWSIGSSSGRRDMARTKKGCVRKDMMLGIVPVGGEREKMGGAGEESDIDRCGRRGVMGHPCVLQATTAVASAARRPIRSAHGDVHTVGAHQQCDDDEHGRSEGCVMCICELRVGGDM